MQSQISNNINAYECRNSPNGSKLVDGAIQRASVAPKRFEMAVKVNKEKVGASQRPHQGITSSASAYMTTDPWSNYASYQNKIARIYMP